MYRIYFLSLLLIPGVIIEANHFRGGTITWKPINNNVTAGSIVSIMITQTYTWTLSEVGCNSSMIAAQSPLVNTGLKPGNGLNLTCIASCSTSGGYVGNEVPVVGYCTDFSAALELTVSQRSDIVNLTAGAYFTAAFAAYGGWQTLALGISTGWSLSTLIDLGVRSDNGLINTPPVATCISYISVPVSVQQSIQIPIFDADNDVLRCRFANGLSECVNACPPGSLPSGTTLSSSCILTITGFTVADYYLVAIQVEDFITNSSTTPMSSVPLQFLIYVYAVPTCALQPLLITDVNSGACLDVQVGVSFTMTFTAINQCGGARAISDIPTLSFPIVVKSALVQNTNDTSLWSMDITWIPMANQVGPQVFCAVATDNASVQSDQYCLTLFVGLSSVPLCPGATVAPTTMMQTSTGTDTTMDITSLSINETSTMTISSSLLSSTVKEKNPFNWGLIVGLSLLALALTLCCLLCCGYHLFGVRAKRRRRNKIQESDHTLEWKQGNRKSPAQLLRGRDSSVTIISDLRTPNCVIFSIINPKENSLIENKGNVTSKQPSAKTIDSLTQSKLFVRVPEIDRQDTMTQLRTLAQTSDKNPRYNSAVSQNSSDSVILLSSPSTSPKTNCVIVTKLSRVIKSALEPHRSTSTISGRTELKVSKCTDLNYSDGNITSSQLPSTVSVIRLKRPSSVGRINHTTTVSSNNNLNQVTVTKLQRYHSFFLT